MRAALAYADTLPRPDRRHDEHALGTALLEGLHATHDGGLGAQSQCAEGLAHERRRARITSYASSFTCDLGEFTCELGAVHTSRAIYVGPIKHG